MIILLSSTVKDFIALGILVGILIVLLRFIRNLFRK